MDPNTQPEKPEEQPTSPDLGTDTVPDAIEPDTSSANVIQPAAPPASTDSPEASAPPVSVEPVVDPFTSPVPAAAPVAAVVGSEPPKKKKTTLILIVVLGVLVLAAGVAFYISTTS